VSATKYEYSISVDFPDHAVATDRLISDIRSSAIVTAVDRIDTSGDDCDVWFKDALSGGDETILDGLVAAHEAIPLDPITPGGFLVDPLPSPSGLAVVPTGSPGSTVWGYSVTAYSATGETLECAEVMISNGAAVLGEVNYNRLTWSAVDGAVRYGVYRTTSGGNPATVGRIRRTINLTCDDTGLTTSGGLPSENMSGAIVLGSEVEAGSVKKLDVREMTSDNATVTSLVSVSRRSSEVVEAGFGSGYFVRLDDADGDLRDAGALHILWADPDTGEPESDFRVMLRDGGTSMEERLRITYGGRLELAGVTVIKIDTCRIGFPVDTGIRGGSAASSSNNDVPSVTFAAAAESRIRWTCRPPQNYISGDLTLRVLCSFAGTPGNTGVRWRLDWGCFGASDVLPASYPHYVESTQNENDKANDTLFYMEFTIPAAQFDKTKDMLVLYLRRDGDHAGDTCTLTVHVHMVELQYTGRQFAGQPCQ